MTKANNGYTIKEGTIYLTKAYAKLAYTPGTKEFRELAELHKAFPDFPIVQRTAKPKKDKEKHDGLTIIRMEIIIKDYIRDDSGLAEFLEVKKYYKGMNGYYGKVKGWFLNKYPNYQEKINFANVAAASTDETAQPEAADTND